jgi:membrane protease YdiL (CAAX protease family)
MENPLEIELSWPLIVGACLLMAAGLAVWTVVAARARQGLPVLPFAPRRPVPWRGGHVVLIFVVSLALGVGIQAADAKLFDLPRAAAPAEGAIQVPATENPVLLLLRRSPTWGTLLLCGVAAVIVAPIVEEVLFRLVLQGWLEAVERRWRRRFPAVRRLIPGMVPVVAVSLLFGALHYRPPTAQTDPRYLAHLLAGDAVARVLALAFALGVLWFDAGARAVDLGWVRKRVWGDAALGVLAFFAVGVVIYFVSDRLNARFPANVADPLTLFLFSLILGTLYYRTHRIVPVIALHMALNFTSLTLAWLQLRT